MKRDNLIERGEAVIGGLQVEKPFGQIKDVVKERGETEKGNVPIELRGARQKKFREKAPTQRFLFFTER